MCQTLKIEEMIAYTEGDQDLHIMREIRQCNM